jgi:hypothetical protein
MSELPRIERILRRRLARRSFGAGVLAGLATPFLPRLEALAAGGAEPKRIFFFTAPNGLPLPRNGLANAPNEFWPRSNALELRRITEPLKPHEKDVVLVKGLEMKSFIGYPHNTAEALYTNVRNGGTSIDHLIGQAISRPGQRPVLRLAVHIRGGRSRAHRVGTQSAEMEVDPHRLAQDLFAGVGAAAGGEAGEQALTRATAQRRRLLERLRGDLDDLKAELGPTDRAILEHHHAQVGALLASLDVQPSAKGCGAPPVTSFDPNSYDDSPKTFKAYLDIVRSAFACDLTRVATLQYGQYVAGTRFPFLRMPNGSPLPKLSRGADDSGARDTHHAYSHLIEEGMGPLVEAYRYFFQNIASFVADLKNTPVPGGGTLFDHTLIVTSNELGAGIPHTVKNTPFLLIGGGWHFKTGRYHQKSAESHGKLLVEICRAMGLKLDQVGDANSQGGMPELT